MIDISKIRTIPIEQVARALGMQITRGHRALCPFHNDHHPSLHFDQRTGHNGYRCFACGAHGDAIDLVMNRCHVSFKEACSALANSLTASTNGRTSSALAITVPPSPAPEPTASPTVPTASTNGRTSSALAITVPPSPAPAPTASPTEHSGALPGEALPLPLRGGASVKRGGEAPDLRYLEQLMAHPYLSPLARHFLFDERRLDPGVIRRLGISSIETDVAMSYDVRQGWFHAPALLIPYRDVKGKLMSVQARRLAPPPRAAGSLPPPLCGEGEGHRDKQSHGVRFQFPRGSHPMLFNLPQLADLSPGDDLFITEGVTDCLAVLSAGYKAIAIPSATLLNQEDIALLRSAVCSPQFSAISMAKPVTLHMAPDNDAPGQQLFSQLRAAFPTLVHHQLPPGCKDIAEYWISSPGPTQNQLTT